MKNVILLSSRISLVFVLLCSVFFATAQIDTIKIDLGDPSNQSPAPWNNLTDFESGSIADCTNLKGESTGISVAVTDAFSGINNNGLAANDSLDLAAQATADSFFGHPIESTSSAAGPTEPTGGVTFSNLDPTKAYSFAFFACRESTTDSRGTQYEVVGANEGTTSLNASSNVDYMVRVSNITPKSDGTITVTASATEDNTNNRQFFYLNTIVMTYPGTVTSSSSLEDVSLAIKIYPNPASEFIHVNLNAKSNGVANMEIYNLTGEKVFSSLHSIFKGNNLVKLPTSNLSNGIYILKIAEGRNIYNSKFLVRKN